MTSHSTKLLYQLDPSRRAEAEARAASRKPNDAFKVGEPKAAEPAKAEKVLPGFNPQNIRPGGRKQAIDDQT